MSHESRINEALKHLGEEHRLGMIKVEEFRNRRRILLESWGERDATTSPGGAARSLSTTQTNPGSRATAAPAAPTGNARRFVVPVIVLGVAAVAALGWKMKRPAADGSAATASAPPAAQRSAELLAVMREANAFRIRNHWEAEDTEAFLQQWRSLTTQDRRLAQHEPSLQSLRYELEQNIKAERQALEVSANPDGQARLDRLTAFAAALTEEGS